MGGKEKKGKSKDQDGSFNHESMQDQDSVLRYLAALSDGIKNGTLQLSSNGSQFVLNPGKLMSFEVDAKKRGNKSELSFRLRWKHAKKEPTISGAPLTMAVVEESEEAVHA